MIEFDTQIIPTARAMSFLFSGRVQLSGCAKNFVSAVLSGERFFEGGEFSAADGCGLPAVRDRERVRPGRAGEAGLPVETAGAAVRAGVKILRYPNGVQ